MSEFRILRSLCVFVLALNLSGLAEAGITSMKKGEGSSEISGSAGPTGSTDTASDLEHCDKPMGTVAVTEPQSHVIQSLNRYGLQSPTGLIRLLIQQSNCFLVLERGVGMRNLMQERSLAESGQLREESNVGGGQMVTADFILTPSVVFSENNAGSIGGAIGGLFGRTGRLIGGIAGGLKFKEAQTSMLLADVRSSIQVAAAEGSAKKADFGFGGLLGAGGVGGALGGYGKTNEGKVIAASLADNYNNIVLAVRGNSSLQRNVNTLDEEAGTVTEAGDVFNVGDLIRAKIANVKLYTKPNKSSGIVATLGRREELIYMGEKQDGFLSVETSSGAGWVKKVFVTH